MPMTSGPAQQACPGQATAAAHVSGAPENFLVQANGVGANHHGGVHHKQPSKPLQLADVRHSSRAGLTLYSFLRLTKGLLALLCQM